MAETTSKVSQQQPHQSNLSLEPLFHALDPISLILNQNSLSKQQPFPLRLTTTDSFIMERGPRYGEYAKLREKRLQMKFMKEEKEPQKLEPKLTTTPRKYVKFQGNLAFSETESSAFALCSVPDFSAVLRKENRKPVNGFLPSMLTPPSKSLSKIGDLSSSRGSKSANTGEKKNIRKSYASFHELKSLSSATANAINGEGKGGRNNRVIGKTVSGYRHF